MIWLCFNVSRLVQLVGALIGVLAAPPLIVRAHHGPGTSSWTDPCCRRLSSVHVGLFLGLHNVLLVADPLVSKPVAYLRDRNATLSC